MEAHLNGLGLGDLLDAFLDRRELEAVRALPAGRRRRHQRAGGLQRVDGLEDPDGRLGGVHGELSDHELLDGDERRAGPGLGLRYGLGQGVRGAS